MNFNFDDPNCLIGDFTPVPSEILDGVTALQSQRTRVLKLELGEGILKHLRASHLPTIQVLNSSIRIDENGITLELYDREYFSCPKEVKEAFDCPSQVWLALEAIFVLKQWDKQPPKNGFQLYQAEQPILNRLREYEGIKATLLYSDNEHENVLFLDKAFSFTLIRLLESGVELAQYQDYLDARTGQANLVRKGRTRKRSNRGFGKSR